MGQKYLAEIKAAKKALSEEIRFYKHEQKELNNRLPMDAQDSYSNGYSDAVVHVDQQIDGLNSALKLISEVERLTEENDVLKSECRAHIQKQGNLFKGYQQMKAENAAKDQQIATLKKALMQAIREGHTDLSPASHQKLFDHYVQAQEQEGKK